MRLRARSLGWPVGGPHEPVAPPHRSLAVVIGASLGGRVGGAQFLQLYRRLAITMPAAAAVEVPPAVTPGVVAVVERVALAHERWPRQHDRVGGNVADDERVRGDPGVVADRDAADDLRPG